MFSANREDFSNQRVLRLTLACFLIFSLLEGAAALASGSLSLLGDSAAMLVDSFAYGMNLFAEKLKSGDGHLTCLLGDKGMGGYSIKRRLLFETVIPFISICCLLIVALVVTFDAARVLLELDRGESLEKINPSDADASSGNEVKFMFIFSCFGLIIDIVCSLIFNARGMETFIEKKEVSNRAFKESIDMVFDWEADLDDSEFGDLEVEFEESLTLRSPGSNSSSSSGNSSGCGSSSSNKKADNENHGCIYKILTYLCPSVFLKIDDADRFKKNFNMIAAFTHVSADLIRTVSVLAAAVFSRVTGADVQMCDAYAALIVIASIVCILIPLIRDMVTNTLAIMAEKDRTNRSIQMSSMAVK